jgi:NADH-quinone oxidoreductase subunit I
MGIVKDIIELVRGMKITSRHLGRHAVTLQYPKEKKVLPERSRGMVVLLSDQETGELNCTACMLCMKACPTAAIHIDAPMDENKKKQLKAFDIDFGLCCFCGLCEEACNFAALKMSTKFEYSSNSADDAVWDIKKLQEVGLDVPYTPRPKKKPVVKKPVAEASDKENEATEAKEAVPTPPPPPEAPAPPKPEATAETKPAEDKPADSNATDKIEIDAPDDGEERKDA